MNYQIYRIDVDDQPKYIGQTIKTIGYKKRFNQHKSTAKNDLADHTLLKEALRTIDHSRFTLILIEDDIDEALINEREQFWINYYNTFYLNGNGYNMTIGGGGTPQYAYTSEVRSTMSIKIREAWNRLRADPERLIKRNNKISSTQKGRPKSIQQRQQISQTRLINHIGVGEENPFWGKHHSDITKDLISKVNGAEVLMIDINTDEIIQEFQSAIKAAEYLISIGKTTNKYANAPILWTCHNKRKSAYGYKWKFK